MVDHGDLFTLLRKEAAQSSSPPSSCAEKASLHAANLPRLCCPLQGLMLAIAEGFPSKLFCGQDKKSTLGMHLTQLQTEDPKLESSVHYFIHRGCKRLDLDLSGLKL